MLSSVREIETSGKSFACTAYDIILRPVYIALGMRKIVHIQPNCWETKAYTHNLLVAVISSIVVVFFAPLIGATLLLKYRSKEHHWRYMQYQVHKKESCFERQGLSVQQTIRREGYFSFQLQKGLSEPFSMAFTWFGKCRHSSSDIM